MESSCLSTCHEVSVERSGQCKQSGRDRHFERRFQYILAAGFFTSQAYRTSDVPAMKRFRFGSNWESFARNALNAERVDQARRNFRALLADISLPNCSFLEIGFGQGLVAAMASEGGAHVTAIDIDPDCHTAYRLTREFFPGG